MKLYSLIFLALVLGFSSVDAQTPDTHGTFQLQKLFAAGSEGYFTFRIASMVTTKEGTLLAFAAARKGVGGDWDPINIVMRRSTDYGKTWEPLQLVVSDGNMPCDNAMPITDYQTGEVHLLYQIDYARCFYMKSSDDGKTWTKATEITSVIDQFKETYPWRVLAPGPGHGIQMRNGRLVVPFWLSDGGSKEHGPQHRGHRPSIVVSVYSDDHGKTWQAGEVAVPDNEVSVIPNETSLIQLADGRVMFNSRNESQAYRRLITYSKDGATDWTEPYFHDAFFEPICFASMARFSMQPYQSKNRILFCNPDSRHDPWIAERPATPRSAKSRHRTNLTLRMSYDEGITWPVSKVIDPNIAGYSDIAVTPDGMIHVLYEGGVIEGQNNNMYKNKQMSVASFDLAWLTEGKDHLEAGDQALNTGYLDPTPTRDQAIIQLIDQYAEARQSKDSTLLSSLLTEDIDQLVSSGVWRRGYEESFAGMMHSSVVNAGTRTLRVEHIRFLNPITALADARYVIQNDDGSARKMWSTFVLAQKQGKWKIAGIRNMLPAARR